MKNLLAVILFLIAGGITAGGQNVHLLSWKITDTDSLYEIKYDTCRTIKEMPGFNKNDKELVVYNGENYYFEVVILRQEWRHKKKTHYYHPVYRYHGVAVCYGKPYSLEKVDYGFGNATIWLVPMKFHHLHQISNMRAFVFSTDKQKIKRMHEKR